MKVKCKKCGGTVEVTELREFKTCKCGAVGLDYGDGYYYRVIGNPKDIDGEIIDPPQKNETAKKKDSHILERIKL